MDLTETLLELEQRLMSQATRLDAEEISRLIADDFTEFGASGGIWHKPDIVEQLPGQPFTPRTISEFAVKQLSPNTALVTYHCHTGSITSVTSLRSSIWRLQGDRWQMVSHQGTLIPRSDCQHKTCRSEPARDGDGSFNIHVD